MDPQGFFFGLLLYNNRPKFTRRGIKTGPLTVTMRDFLEDKGNEKKLIDFDLLGLFEFSKSGLNVDT